MKIWHQSLSIANTRNYINSLGHINTYSSELVKLMDSKLLESKGENAVYLEGQFNASILVRNCTFRNNMNGALLVRCANYQEIIDSLITKNTGAGIYIEMSIDNVVRHDGQHTELLAWWKIIEELV